MLGLDLPTYLKKLKDLVEQAAYWAGRARHWARVALTGVGIVIVKQGIGSMVVGSEEDAFTYFVVNDDLHSTTFFLISNPVPGTTFQIRNDGFGLVQVQGLDDVVISSPASLILRGNGAVVSLVAVRAKEGGAPALWNLVGDVKPL